MDRTTAENGAANGRWTRAAVIIVRVALLVFLLWALISANFPGQTPVAEDAVPSHKESQAVVAPCSDSPNHLG